MTIAFGVLSSDGLVLAADTQETVPGFMKTGQGKIMGAYRRQAFGNNPASCLISGAGDAIYLDAIMRAQLERFSKGPQLDSEGLKNEWGRVLAEFHAEHIAPLAGYPSIERPGVSLLIAYSGSDRNTLFASAHSVLAERSAYCAVGAGEIQARNLLARFFQMPFLDTWRTILLASYVMFHVKESIDGCGDETDIFFIRNERFGYVRRPVTAQLESAMRDYGYETEPIAFRSALGIAPEAHQGQRPRAAAARFKKLLTMISKGTA